MGSLLYLYRYGKFECELDCLYPNNIHGIVAGENNVLAVFGAKSICICNIVKVESDVRIRKQSTDQFNDWIIAIKWISFEEQEQLAILFAHNYIAIYNTLERTSRVIRCEESCILYGGSISGTCQENLVIFSGTVFQEILIWTINNRDYGVNKSLPVLHRLSGHKGVIFSVACDLSSRFICSTSDDRSVRFWKITEQENSEGDNINWQRVKVVPIKTMFVHTARVWKALIRNNTILTIGEDSLVCTWSFSGNLLNKARYKAPIWSIDVSEDDMTVYVGGGDGSVYLQPFKNYKSPETIFLSGNDTCNFPKYISYLDDGAILVFTESGTLLYYSKEITHKSTIQLAKDHYYIMQVSPNRDFVAFASREGCVIIYEKSFGTLQQCEKQKILNSQILSLQWLSNDKLIACGENGLIKIFWFKKNCICSNTVIAECILPSSRERWLTAAIIIDTSSSEGLLICGDRAGNIYVYKLEKESNFEKPIQTLHKIHGKMGVQSFHIFGGNLITTGRDGMLRFFQVRAEDTKPLSLLHKKKMPMDWISNILILNIKRLKYDTIEEREDEEEDKEKEIFVLGFKQVDFIIYNLINENIMVRIPCGGGHRSWDCIISQAKANFAYIKNKQIHVCDLSSSLFSTCSVLQNGFHIKETHCLRYISWNNKDVFISGGEDCTLRFSNIDRHEIKRNSFKNIGIFNGHLSGIKCISVIQLHKSRFQYLIFSGGGRAQLKIWEINVKEDSSIYQRYDTELNCSDLNSHLLYEQNQLCKKPWQEAKQTYVTESETRYMDICAYYPSFEENYVLVFIACADGYLRLFVYDIITNNVYLKVSTKYVDRCIFKIHILSYESKVIVLTMSTDGKLRFFDFTDTVSKVYEDAKCGNRSNVNYDNIPFAELGLHQSGINCFDLTHMHENEYLLITGGDDNLLSAVYFQISVSEKKLSTEILSKWSTASAHSAQIIGVRFNNDKIYSVGVDQQFITHSYLYSNGVIHVDILNQVFTSVTDVQGMELYPDRCDYVCIYGRGFQIFSI
ncbi:hypothetical protein PUN28_005435 [Cardiocondyla obscurior]